KGAGGDAGRDAARGSLCGGGVVMLLCPHIRNQAASIPRRERDEPHGLMGSKDGVERVIEPGDSHDAECNEYDPEGAPVMGMTAIIITRQAAMPEPMPTRVAVAPGSRSRMSARHDAGEVRVSDGNISVSMPHRRGLADRRAR
ncbi:MAG: hypothetical protein KGO02_09810, partial [Alphaproteobacteria bacterium]|nr:hypothetical protein [Alphaproteobacteria bacterium]